MNVYRIVKSKVNIYSLSSVLKRDNLDNFVCTRSTKFKEDTLLVPVEGSDSVYLFFNATSVAEMLNSSIEKTKFAWDRLRAIPSMALTEEMLKSELEPYIEEEEKTNEVVMYSNVSVDSVCSKIFYYSSNTINRDSILRTFGQDVKEVIENKYLAKEDLYKFRADNVSSKEYKMLIEVEGGYIVIDTDVASLATGVDRFKVVLAMHLVSQKLKQTVEYIDILALLARELGKAR